MSCKIRGTSFVFKHEHGETRISFGDSGALNDNIGVNNTKENLLEFREKFSKDQNCSIKFSDKKGELVILHDEDEVEFNVDYHKLTYYTTCLVCKYDLCKDAVLECIDYHLDHYKWCFGMH